MMKRIAEWLVLVLALGASGGVGAAELSGSWRLDAAMSDNLEDSAKALNDRLNEEKRSRPQEFDKSSSANGGNRYQRQVDAVERMIREDNRSRDWGGPPAVREMLNAEHIKLYQSRKKVVVLYDGEHKRLLRINPAGRAFSLSGSEITHDELGRALTFVEGDDLVIETELDLGGKLIERYTLEGERLIVVFQQRDLSVGPWLELRREFMRAE